MSAVIVSFSGGLGNQLFQYAAGLELSVRWKVPLFAETTFYKRSPNRNFVLDQLNLPMQSLSGFLLYKTLRVSHLFWGDLWRKAKRLHQSPYYFQEAHFEYDQRIQTLAAPAYLSGYWQSERYFTGVAADLRNQLQLPLSDAGQKLSRQIDEKSVCLHIRRGDYTRHPEIARIHGLCDADYYRRTIRAMQDRLENPRFFIFTDEPSAAGFIRDLIDKPVFVRDYLEEDEIVEFTVMQQFSNFILANSTFSWWAAWLSCKTDKVVLCPERWFADPSKNTSDLYPSGWLKY